MVKKMENEMEAGGIYRAWDLGLRALGVGVSGFRGIQS